MISRRNFVRLALGAGAAAAGGTLLPAQVSSAKASASGRISKPGRFRFVHFTDIHLQPELRGARGYAQAIAHINRQKPDFALSGGDNVFDTLKADSVRRDRLWDLYTELTRGFKCPVYHTMGNHDNWALSRNDVSPDTPGYGKQTYLSRLGLEKTYYSFDHKGWHFIVLDSIAIKDVGYDCRLDGAQRSWLEADLAAHKEQPKIVSLHVPVMSIKDQAVAGPLTAPNPGYIMHDAQDLRQLFETSRVRLVLQGHVHIREQVLYNEVHYISTGAVSGSWWNGPRYGHPEGYAVVEVDGEDFVWTYHTYGWNAAQASARLLDKSPFEDSPDFA